MSFRSEPQASGGISCTAMQQVSSHCGTTITSFDNALRSRRFFLHRNDNKVAGAPWPPQGRPLPVVVVVRREKYGRGKLSNPANVQATSRSQIAAVIFSHPMPISSTMRTNSDGRAVAAVRPGLRVLWPAQDRPLQGIVMGGLAYPSATVLSLENPHAQSWNRWLG